MAYESSSSQQQLKKLLSYYQSKRYDDAEKVGISFTQKFPKHPFGWKILGAVFRKIGKESKAVNANQKVVLLSPEDANAHYNLGVLLKETGRLEDAEVSYRKAIALKPNYIDAYNNLGVTLKELDRLTEAEKSLRHAIVLEPNYSVAHNNLGNTLQELGRLEEAEASLRQAIVLRPDYAVAHNNLGITLQELGRLEEAKASLSKAIVLKPDYAGAYNNLGNTLQQLGRLEESEASYRQTILLKSRFFEAHSNLGNILQKLGRLKESEASLRLAIVLKPDYSVAHNNLGNTLKELGRLDESEASYRQAIAFKPDYANAYNNLGVTLQELGRLEEAEASYRQAIGLSFDYAEAYSNLGLILKELNKLEEAEACYRQAIVFKNDFSQAHHNLGITLKELGRLDESEAHFRKAIALKPDYVDAHSNLLFLKSSTSFNATHYLEDAQNFSDAIGMKISSQFSEWFCSKDPKHLRIGFVSGDFKAHPVGYFLEGLLAQLQSSSLELYAYPTSDSVDELTVRVRALFHSWVPLVGKSDNDAAKRIHDDNIHILIDLSGHTKHNRLPVFSWKPAPIQVSWLGYFASTGLSEIDYVLGDPFVTPHEEANHFIEKIWQLPESYLCLTPPDIDLEVGPLPALSNGFLTFGCFNKLSRMTDQVVLIRSKILHAVPGSKLFLKDKKFSSQSVRDWVVSRFATHGVCAKRLIFEGSSPRTEYLACYNHIDIALSPFPYGGGTTSAEGLWMGVPVITKRGNHFLSHLGESIAHNAGLSDWIAVDEANYVAKAIKFSSNVDKLAALRANLREQVLYSPLFDALRFANHFEQAAWKMRRTLDQT